jgi:cysteinyl-tRNA synthetase
MQLGEQKMSKSTGRLIGIKETLSKYSADSVRLWVLSSHYRSPITYSDENLEATEKGVERLCNTTHIETKKSAASAIDHLSYKERFTEAMDDDFNTPQAVAALFDLAREINRGRDEGLNIVEAQKALRELGRVLGLILPKPLIKVVDESVNIDEVKDLIKEREDMRIKKDWRRADEIRHRLKELGVTLEDTPQGTVWRYRKP